MRMYSLEILLLLYDMKVRLLPKSTLEEERCSYAPFNVICQIIIHGIK